MNSVFITPGTGSYYCGVCMRDNALVAALRRAGHSALMLPMYLPTLTDEPSVSEGLPIFFGGINVYLQQNHAFFRSTPTWLDALFDAKPLLRAAARRSGMTQGAELGEMTLSMLRGEQGNQRKEVEKLVRWLRDNTRPDAIFLSTLLQIGLARRLREQFRVPIVCFLQGEDTFLDSLDPSHRSAADALIAERSKDVDVFVAPSRFFAEAMGGRVNLPAAKLRVIPNGISLEGFVPRAAATEGPTRIGFLARLNPVKGLPLLIEAFIRLRDRSDAPEALLEMAGTATAEDERFLDECRARLASTRLADQSTFRPNLSREAKLEFLRSLSVMSVPVTYGEAFGLYVIEAWATGVPVVLPRIGALPELVEAAGGGLLYPPGDVEALAGQLHEVLSDPNRAHAMGQAGRAAVERDYTIDRMAERITACVRELS